ncbi:hypothetical protein BWI93_02310 [Siphonobacter sp. BAB-5385]|uniref:sialidase family protein n=1 Tax=unclassified Siphonobacter TaxID=2635712 RepID=UPI000B9E286C|nr:MULTISPECIES: sialidase family protein [unclassified Siphonobacter]OZI09719.1 hypothetical protein BWI93_02310 [Siphonobacter sp. BAB-5385]PMD92407.1 hypothetical protein BWI97_20150 [Siphonobacter sp. BAB-5405]
MVRLTYFLLLWCLSLGAFAAHPLFSDTTKVYGLPLLTKTPKGDVILSWTEKDNQSVVGYYFATSTDQGQHFSDKQLIFSAPGIGTGQLMRPKLIFKGDGTWVAVFTYNPKMTAKPMVATTTPAAAPQGGGHEGHGTRPTGGGGRPNMGDRKAMQVVYTFSKNAGKSWSTPQPVYQDVDVPALRGFFDATVMANGEVAVAYLKDVVGSTKHEERDLRLVVSKGDRFEPEQLLDPTPCDCCPISLLTDTDGKLNVYYRDNRDNIRDIARLVSKDNGKTFSQSEILHDDNWQINGCPHSGAVSVRSGKSGLVSWFSAGKNEPGLRLVTTEGKKLLVITDPSAKNAALVGSKDGGVLLWDQNKQDGAGKSIAYRTVKGTAVSDTKWLNETASTMNPSGLMVGNNQLLIASEVATPQGKNSIQLTKASL